jgi:hypothetical protein
MSERAITRRSLLASGAGALAAGLLQPHAALAALAGPPPVRLSDRYLGELAAGSVRTVTLARPADLVGIEWRAPARARVELRFRDGHGAWSPWASASSHGHGPDGQARGQRVVGEPLWAGGTSELQLRATPSLSGVRLHLVDVSNGLGARRLAAGPLAASAALALAGPPLASGPGQPPIIARRAWAQGAAPPHVAPAYGAVRMAFVHHTQNPNGYAPGEVPAMLRAIYAFHRYVNGWNDIGYNFVLDSYGRIFEARAGGIQEPVVGAHAGGYNLASTGVAVLGSFMSTAISAAAQRSLEGLLAWKLSLHGVPAVGRVTVRVNPAGAVYSRFPANARVPLERISGHRDADSTDCPGNVLYGELPGIRSRVNALAGRPSRLTLALAAAPAPATAPGAPAAEPSAPGRALGGTLAFLDGTAIAGATVQLQARSPGARGGAAIERTIAEAPTDAQGRWSVPGPYVAATHGGIWLRALCVGGPAGSGATISEPLHVAPVAPLSPPAAAAPTSSTAPPPAP